MANITGKVTSDHTYDAIVVGSGISGGWAAKELTEKGLKMLLLERGRDVPHGAYPTAFAEPWELDARDNITPETRARQPKQSRTNYTTKPSSKHGFVDDIDNPSSETKSFDWMRGYHVGGRSLNWGRQSYRWSDLDFEANAKDGHGVDWPIRYADLAPWYDYVEKFAGISGSREGLPQLPDGTFLPPLELRCVEKHAAAKVAASFSDRRSIIGRVANLTVPHNGRANCQSRDRCIRGCPYGAYFSSNSTTLPAAYATGNLILRPHSIVTNLIHDADSARATGVSIIDAEAGEQIDYHAKVIFLCASAIGSTYILLNSSSDRFPTGFGNDSGELGHNLMDHHFKVGASGRFDGFHDRLLQGTPPQRHLHSPLSQPRRHRHSPQKLRAWFRLPRRRLPLQLSPRYRRTQSRRRHLQGLPHRPRSLAHGRMGRTPAVPRKHRLFEHHSTRQMGPPHRHVRLRIQRERKSHEQGHAGRCHRDPRNRRLHRHLRLGRPKK
ncbi:MAG: GMC family oxidoreductase [Candidatus Synoicihabitans palmerolidicus]|nr:GMC family oxidoreductase [Candidatus Synoicihabitans palmerolidicus]